MHTGDQIRMLKTPNCRTDDELRTNLRSQLAALRPVEVVIPSKGLSAQTRKVLQASLRKPRLNQLQPDSEFWSADGP